MNYFCDVTLVAGKDKEKRIFLVLNDIKENISPELKKETLIENGQFRDFCHKYKPRIVSVEYTMYSTEKEVFASSQDEIFIEILQNGEASKIAQAEFFVDKNSTKSNTVKRKKKKSPVMITVFILCGILICGVALVGGISLGRSSVSNYNENTTEKGASNEDGMIIPIQNEIDENAEQLTVTIDRSYSAVPTEDIQLKGEIIEGKASITLPEFDKTDFFSHVAGYTWGFSTDPDGKKIEYYGGNTYSFSENIKLYRVLVKYGGGSGTKDDPYIIDYFDQLELLSEEKARGYFKQTADIYFPDWTTHIPIDTVNELKSDPDSEHFEYDGGGFVIENLTSSLFGKVSGAVIKNVNIKNSVVSSSEHKDFGVIVCNAYNYSYVSKSGVKYETGETLIQNCSVSHTSLRLEYPPSDEPVTEVVTAPVVIPPDVIEYDEDGNEIQKTTQKAEPIEPQKVGEHCVGAITGIGGQIENCYVTDFGIFAYLNDYFLYAGGISGKPANVINSAVYYYSAKGNIFYGGGIAGNCGGARMYNAAGEELPSYYGGKIQGCTARNIIISVENAAGGIAGEGSTNADGALISNCYSMTLSFNVGITSHDENNGIVTTGFSGGIIGADGEEKNGHIIKNTVSPSELRPIGNMKVSKYDETIRQAPAFAYYQENILSVINKNTVDPVNPKEIFTGNFKFGNSNVFGDSENGSLAYPANIEDLFAVTFEEE